MSEPPHAPPYPPYPPQQGQPRQGLPQQGQPQQGLPQQQYQGQPARSAIPQRPQQPYLQQPPPRQVPQRRPDPETSSQVRAAYAARAELGPEYDDAIAAGLAERVEELAAYRTAELRQADARAREDREDGRRGNTQRFVLGIVSLGTGVPITAIAAGTVDPGLLGVIAAWAGIVGVNAVFAWGNRRRPRD